MKIGALGQHFKNAGPVLMIVLDGWGLGDGGEGDAIHLARTPIIQSLSEVFAKTRLYTHGQHVGLPSPKDIGGSEVGHMTLGAGRILEQGPTRIKRLLASGAFFKGEVLNRLLAHCLEQDTPLHLWGLLSDGNVHSHIDHFSALIEHAAQRGLRRVYVHALLDGRDVPYQSALDYVEPLEARLAEITRGHQGWDYAIASGGGREVITMDRDRNWDKVRRGWETHVLGRCENTFASATEAVKALRDTMPTAADQDLPPFVIVRDGEPIGAVRDGAAMISMNFRADRAIQFSQAMLLEDFDGFERQARPEVLYAGMMVYDEDTNLPPLTLAPPPNVDNPLGKRIVEAGLTQFRLAESQKYAHVSFFFNGGYREPLDPQRELYHLIPSDRIDSFALAPKMKAQEIGHKARDLIQDGKHKFGLINFANTDMVGHTGDLAAAILAAEAVDQALGGIIDALAAAGGLALITADHGNAEQMISSNPHTGKPEINTRHSLNPVPVYLFDPAYRGEYALREFSEDQPLTLANLAATTLLLLGQPLPDDMAPPLFALD